MGYHLPSRPMNQTCSMEVSVGVERERLHDYEERGLIACLAEEGFVASEDNATPIIKKGRNARW